MYIPIAVGMCLAIVSVTSSRHDIHKRMTPKELQYVFQATHENVPEYKVVDLEVTERVKRDASQETQVNLVGFDKRVSLLLKPASDYLVDEGTRVTLATGSSGRVTYRDDKSIMPRVGKLMRDEATKSSVILSQNNKGAYSLEGYIGSENYVLQPLPPRFSDNLSRKVQSNSLPHVLYRPIESVSIKNKKEFARYNRTLPKMSKSRDNRISGTTAYPELLLVVDDTSYRLHGSDPVRVVRYVVGLWNSIDMLYADLRNPALRINIARIVIGTNAEATPYITKNTWNNTTRSSETLMAAGKYFVKQRDEFPAKTYDGIMIMTKNNLKNSRGKKVMGTTRRGGICIENHDEFMGTGIFSNDGNFVELLPAHEFGHLLGLFHDGTGSCFVDDQYLMTTYIMANKNNWKLSPCSAEIAATELRKHECLYNEPRTNGRPLRPILPGQLLSRDEQCRKTFGTKAYDNDGCVGLMCEHVLGIGGRYVIPGVAEGTPCSGDTGFCLKGECIEYPKDRAAYGLTY